MSPLRKPHENILDPHWLKRGSFEEVEHPELKHIDIGMAFVKEEILTAPGGSAKGALLKRWDQISPRLVDDVQPGIILGGSLR